MKIKPEWYNKRWVGNMIIVCVGILLFVILEHLGVFWRGLGVFFKFLRPVVIGVGIAYVLDPLANLFEKRIFDGIKSENARRITAVTASLILLVLLLVTLAVSLVPQIAASITMFVDNLDNYSKQFSKFIGNLQNFHGGLPVDLSNIANSLESGMNNVISAISANREKIISASYGVGTSLMNGGLGLILAIYFLYGKKSIKDGLRRFFKAVFTKKQYAVMHMFFRRCNAIMVRYIAFDLVDGLIVGIVNWIFMMLTGMPYAVLVSVVVGVTNLAPTFGPMAGAVIGGFILFLANPWHAFFFLLFTAGLQTVDAYILKPKLFGNQLGASPILILVFIIVGGRIFGVMGVLLSIPCAAILDFMYHEFFIEKIEERKKRREALEKQAESKEKKQTAEQES